MPKLELDFVRMKKDHHIDRNIFEQMTKKKWKQSMMKWPAVFNRCGCDSIHGCWVYFQILDINMTSNFIEREKNWQVELQVWNKLIRKNIAVAQKRMKHICKYIWVQIELRVNWGVCTETHSQKHP